MTEQLALQFWGTVLRLLRGTLIFALRAGSEDILYLDGLAIVDYWGFQGRMAREGFRRR